MTAATTAAETPRLRETARRGRFWIVVGVVALAAAVVLAVTSSGSLVDKARLAPDSAAPSGAQALVHVLENHGVEVTIPDGYDEATSALKAQDSTLLVADPNGFLTGERLQTLTDRAASSVVVEPSADVLTALDDEVGYSTHDIGATTLQADCALSAARNAGTMTTSGAAFTVSSDALACFTTDSGDAQLVVDDTTTLVADGTFLDNEHVVAAGNAALALGLTSPHSRLVWYLPTLADTGAGDAPTVQELTPDWVTPVMVLLLLVAGSAALWRGRRLGPLVAEDLPVTVPARETMVGRARLYARSSARRRALDSLRVGALGRLASDLGLARTADAEEIVGAVAAITGRHRNDVAALLLHSAPGTDRELVDASADLAELENDVRRRTQPGGVASTDTNTRE